MSSRLLTVIVGFATGISLALGGLWLSPDAPPPAEDATTTTGAAAPVSWWMDPHETIVASASLIPFTLSLDGGEVVLEYHLMSIGPMMRGFVVDDDDLTGVAPESWTLFTADAEYPGTSSTITSGAARFPVEEGFSLDRVTGIRLDAYRLRIPYTYHIEMSPTEGAQVELPDMRTLSLVTLLTQATSVVVQLRVNQPTDTFATHSTDVTVTGIGAEWRRAGSSQFTGTELFRFGPDVPDPLHLRVHSVYWVPYEAAIDIDLGGIDRG